MRQYIKITSRDMLYDETNDRYIRVLKEHFSGSFVCEESYYDIDTDEYNDTQEIILTRREIRHITKCAGFDFERIEETEEV